MPILSRSILRLLVLIAMAGLVHAASAAEKPNLPLLFSDDFEDGFDHWEPTDPKAWTITATPQGKVLDQHRLSDYKPPHGSPLNIALLKDVIVGDFVMTVNVKSTTGRKNGHRDMCVFFGYQGPARFYYAHQGLRRDAVSNHILIVNDAKRAPITEKTSPGCNWTDEGWHRIKVVRDVERGTIEVYFDDMETPAKTAVDKTFTWGQVGLGSYDDTGQWDDFKLYGRRVTPPGP